MMTLSLIKGQIEKDPKNWTVYFMDFVDEFRRSKDLRLLESPLEKPHNKWDALLASTAMQLCKELHLSTPDWVQAIPACENPWFVSDLENLKAIALVESPLPFRIRKIFVLENFLNRA
jgi:hypothetical protein